MAKKGRRATNEERFAAIQMYDNGLTADRIAEILNVGRSSVFDWIAKYREGGLGSISTKFASGRPTVLDDSEIVGPGRRGPLRTGGARAPNVRVMPRLCPRCRSNNDKQPPGRRSLMSLGCRTVTSGGAVGRPTPANCSKQPEPHSADTSYSNTCRSPGRTTT